MIKLTKEQNNLLRILSKEKGPRVLSGLQKENPGKVKKIVIHTLVKKELVRVRVGRNGRKNRYEIRGAGRLHVKQNSRKG